MINPEIGLEKIVIVTKELGTIVFTDNYKWSNFKKSSITFHSLTQPAFQEYHSDGYSRFVWFCNGKHHRYDGPAIYSFGKNTIVNHKFKLTNTPIENFGYVNDFCEFSSNDAINVYFYLNGVSYGQRLTKGFLEDAKKYSRSAKIKYLFKNDE